MTNHIQTAPNDIVPNANTPPPDPSNLEPIDAGADNETDDNDPLMPVDGDTLAPGFHFFEVATAAPCKRDVLVAGLARIGIQAIQFDQSRPRSAAALAVREHRFVGNVTRAIMLHQRDVMQWEFITPLALDVAKDIGNFRRKLEAFVLEPGTRYEALFIARERSQPTRQVVEEHLNEMGFIAHKLIALARDVRLEARPTVSVAIWFGLLEWDGPSSEVTENDPFFFENLVPVG